MVIFDSLADCVSHNTGQFRRSPEPRQATISRRRNSGGVRPKVLRQRSGELVTQSLTLSGERASGMVASGPASVRQTAVPQIAIR